MFRDLTVDTNPSRSGIGVLPISSRHIKTGLQPMPSAWSKHDSNPFIRLIQNTRTSGASLSSSVSSQRKYTVTGLSFFIIISGVKSDLVKQRTKVSVKNGVRLV